MEGSPALLELAQPVSEPAPHSSCSLGGLFLTHSGRASTTVLPRQDTGSATKARGWISSQALMTLGLILLSAIDSEGQGREKGSSLLPTTPKGRQVAGPALPRSHLQGQLTCSSCNQGQLYYASWAHRPLPENCRCRGVGSVFLLLHIQGQLSHNIQLRGGASSAQLSDVNMAPGSSPDQGCPTDLCCNRHPLL